MAEAAKGKGPPQMAKALHCSAGVLSAPPTGPTLGDAHCSCSCVLRRKDRVPGYDPRCCFVPFPKPCISNECAASRLRPRTPRAPAQLFCLGSRPSLCSDIQMAAATAAQAAPGPRLLASCVFDELESWQTRLICGAHTGSAQAARKSQWLYPRPSPGSFSR